ncbi:MAG: ATP-binding protein [Bacteroidota bacterium]
MNAHTHSTLKPGLQGYLVSLASVLLTASVCFVAVPLTGYRSVALILLLVVSLLSMFLRIGPVVAAASVSALTWDFFFIPPRFTLSVGTLDDLLMLIMYFVIALISVIANYKLRQFEKRDHERIRNEQNLKLYTTLFNSLSHELKTPIATIIGSVDTIRENKLSPLQQEQLMESISVASLRLTDHVDNLLNLSRLDSGNLKLNPDWCDLNDLVNLSLDKINHPATYSRIRIVMPQNLSPVRIDLYLLQQVLINLLNNALQYTSGQITLSLDVVQASIGNTAELVILVADTGSGFSAAQRSNAFNRFSGIGKTDHRGMGLGLSIASGFTEAHGGTIALGEAAGGGAEFTIRIPVDPDHLNRLNHE